MLHKKVHLGNPIGLYMIKNYPTLKKLVPLFFLLFSFSAFSQFVTVTNVSPNPVCAGAAVTVTFSATNGNGNGNQYDATTPYQIYLSDSSGSAYTAIGSTFTASNEPYLTCGGCTTSGLTKTITIPSNYLAGSGYKLTITSKLNNNPNWISGTVPSSPFSIERGPIAPTSVAASSTLMCSGSSTTLSHTGGSGTTFRWLTDSCNGTSVGTGNNLVVSPTTTTTYYGRWENSCGYSSCQTVTVTVNSLPTVNTGPAISAICQGATSSILGGIVGGGATGGTWSSSAGGTFAPSATNLNATWTPPAAYSGTATLTLTTSGGSCGTTSANKTILVNPLPTAAGTINGTATVCQSQNTVAYSVPAIANATSYTWAYSGIGATISGSTASITINFAANATSGNLTVRGTNACVNGTASANYQITVNTTPDTPTITNVSVCSGSSATLAASGAIATEFYKWYSLETGGLLLKTGINNADNTYASPAITTTTDYWVSVVNSNGCESVRIKVTAFVNVNNRWNGSVSINWNNPANWCTGVPSIANNLDVLIPSATTTTYSPTISIGDFGYVENILIESGSVLTVENNYLFVKKNLMLNGEIDLNNEAQLIQSTDIESKLDATSTGTIEIDQQGTGDSFNYNYWSSPVNSNLAAKNYSIGAVLKDGTNPIYKEINFNGSHTWAEGDVGSSPIRLSTYWMYKLENSKGYAAWTRIGNNIPIKVGEGYTMKGSNTIAIEQNYTFVGKPNSGDISLPIAINNDYLVGNPYPSALDAWKFIDENPDTTGPLYFWEHYGGGTHNLAGYQGGYATYTKAGGVSASMGPAVAGISSSGTSSKGKPGRYVPVGQAFFVVGGAANGFVNFNNGQRIFVKESQRDTYNDPYSVFMKSNNTKVKNTETYLSDIRPKFRIGFDAPKISHRQLLLTIDEKATPAVDRGYEAEIYEIFVDDFYWMLENKKYIIQGTNVEGLNSSEFPLGIQLSKTGMVTVKIDALENVDDDTSIYLKDKVTGESFNMREKPVELNLVAGKYTDRFVLVFKAQKLMEEDVKAEIVIPASAQPIIEGIHVYMNNAIRELQIKNNSTEEIVNVALINALGQTVKTWNSNFNIRTISLPISTATGVYLVQINTKTGKTVKKVSVE